MTNLTPEPPEQNSESTPVLVVDDLYENRYLLEVILKSKGYPVESAKNGKEALDYLQNHPVRLIISDIFMPQMDGYQLCREVKKDENLKKIPFVFYTATYTGEEDQAFGLDLGAERYILKLEEKDAFLAEIEEVLAESPAITPSEPALSPEEEEEYLKEYSERVFHKLEEKIRELEKKNQDYEVSEQSLRENRQKYQDLVENINEVIFTLDVDGKFTYVSPVAETLEGGFGYTCEELIGHTFTEILHPEDLAEVVEKFKSSLAGTPRSSEFRVFSKSGEIRWIQESGRRILKNSNVIGFQGLFSDVTERKNFEIALRKKEQEFRAITENSDDAILICDSDLKIERFNSRFAACVQINPASLPGMDISDIFTGEVYEQCKSLSLEVLQTNVPSEREIFIPLPAESRWYRVRFAPLVLDGAPEKLFFYATDIHDITILKQALEVTNKKLNMLTSVIRHDILNYLMVIMTGADMIEMQYEGNAELLKELKYINDGTDAIERLLTFSREYQSLGVKKPRWYLVAELIEEVRKDPGFAETVIDVQVDGCKIFADPLFYRVIFNLFENAVRHGESITTITVQFSTENATGLLIVRDDGTGISEEEKELIFNNKYGKHSGFGLYFAREILDITGISIVETGTFGEGAVFEMRIPEGSWQMDGGSVSDGPV